MIPDLRRSAAMDSLRELGWFEHVEWFEEIDSTNRAMVRQVKEGQVTLPALMVADSQTHGAGRGANRWYSPTGCLMFSLGLSLRDLPLPADAGTSLLPLQVGLSVAQALGPLSRSKPMVKWPNDVI